MCVKKRKSKFRFEHDKIENRIHKEYLYVVKSKRKETSNDLYDIIDSITSIKSTVESGPMREANKAGFIDSKS